ncbi:precorrin 6A synthase [Pseudomonas sp. 21]|uniref:precorrin-6A synthase (deacetylating) n=1 Tax=unclassified Pseudomonas TaxID=196821 RepID=UPI0005EBD4AC|nr:MULTISPECIES: precorrin-6A synthase (deacetylating) [unclassified Pseudomonas]KJJ97877.1 precorrin 6A synthase [Pseudomonas sp. 21]MBV7586849.1 precorrin-6A synthase (deacetylating) [Pseudomonas sp. PDM33]
MKQLLIIGIGAGDPEYLTVQAINAMNRADVFFLMDKGASKDKLLQLRRDILGRYVSRSDYRIVEADSPERVREGDYAGQVRDLNQAKQQVFERLIADELQEGQCGAFLVWGDPSLYDSTLRILDAVLREGRVNFDYQVIPGITSVQALAARHRVPLNAIGQSVQITTGRRLAEGFPANAGSVVVMLDAEDTYCQLDDPELEIYWGAYVGTPDEILRSGRLTEVGEDIRRTRQAAREANGWIMDTYLLRRAPKDA